MDVLPDDAELENPYAPPRASFAPPAAAPGVPGSIPCSIEGVLSTTWSVFRGNMGPCLWLFWGMVVPSTAYRTFVAMLQLALQAAMPGDSSSVAFMNFGLAGTALILQTWLEIGMYLGLLKVVRGEPVSFDVLFSGGRYLLAVILALIVLLVLYGVAMVLPVLVGLGLVAAVRDQAAAFIIVGIAVGASLFFMLFYLSARLLQFLFLIIDRDAGFFDSLRSSWALTRGRAGMVMVVFLAQFTVMLAGILAFCVGAIFAWPLASLLRVVLYLGLAGSTAKRQPPVLFLE